MTTECRRGRRTWAEPPGPPIPREIRTRRARIAALLGILVLAGALRLPALADVPPGVFRDEASTGYDAFCLATTGRDQYGKPWPLFARSFGDYNESAYRFLAVPFVAAMGLGEVSVRLPAALAGVLAVLMLYLLARAWMGTPAALAAALMLAVSPWHVALSRIAFRAILLPPLLCLALWLFHKALEGGRRALPWAALAFAACLYTYSTARVFVPLFLLLSALLFRRELWPMRRLAALAALLFVAALLPLLLFWTSEHGMARAHSAVLTDDPLRFLANYASYFGPDFLLLHGDPNLRASPLGSGQIHLFEALTVPLGLVALLRRRGRARGLAVLWLLLYPIPAAYTAPSHALRAIVGAPLLALLSGRGLTVVVGWGRTLPWCRVLAGLCGAVILGSTALFGLRYFRDYPTYATGAWQGEMRAIVREVARRTDPCVHVSDRFLRGHIFFLFYESLPCAPYQSAPRAVRPLSEPPEPYRMGRIRFGPTAGGPADRPCLLIVPPADLPALQKLGRPFRRVHTVSDPAGRPLAHFLEFL